MLVAAAASADKYDRRARALVKQYLLVDSHIDVPNRINEHWEDVTRATAEGQFDYPRAVQGGLNVPFMSIYTPASSENDGSAYALANTLIDQVEAIVQRAPQRFALATSTSEVEEQFQAGQISLALGMENGAPIQGSLDKLQHFYERGIRYITLAHSQSNHISDSSYDKVRMWQGLSPFGAEVVARMNKLGIMIDISHVSDQAAYEVLASSAAPVLASHSSTRALVQTEPVFERNMDDELIKALAKNGGVIMINFGSSFVTTEAGEYRLKYRPAATAYAKRHGYKSGSPELKAFAKAYRSKHPYPFATVQQVADHFDHVKNLVGIDYVGIGSDYDGVGNSLPVGLKDVASYPVLVAELLRRGYSEQDIEKLLGGNLMRVWKAVEERAG
ncbi:MAG: dipeptidase [Halieaceae bacterium]